MPNHSPPRETSFMSTVVDLDPQAAAQRYDAWAEVLLTRPGVPSAEGHVALRLEQGRRSAGHSWVPLRGARGELRAARRSIGGISLELTAWSASRTELAIRYLGIGVQPGARYYAIGHTALTELAAALLDDGPVSSPRMFMAAAGGVAQPQPAIRALGRLARMATSPR